MLGLPSLADGDVQQPGLATNSWEPMQNGNAGPLVFKTGEKYY